MINWSMKAKKLGDLYRAGNMNGAYVVEGCS